jgi:hypothetical protein
MALIIGRLMDGDFVGRILFFSHRLACGKGKLMLNLADSQHGVRSTSFRVFAAQD